jgi:hypothetical protein
MTLIDVTPHSRGAMRPSLARKSLPNEIKGRREYRALNAPAALRAKIKSTQA